MKKTMICMVIVIAGLLAIVNNASAATVLSPLDAGPTGGGSVQGTFETGGYGHKPVPAGWAAASGSQLIDLYNDAGKNTGLCLTWPNSTNETYTAQYTYTSTAAAANKLYTLKLLAGSHVNWDSGTVDYTATIGTDNGGTYTAIGTSGTKTVTFSGASAYLGDMAGTYISDFKIMSGSSVPAGNLVIRITVVTHGVYWGAFDNVQLTVEDAVDPVIDTQPITQVVKADANAVFIIAGQNIVSYLWYKGTTALSDGGNISGSATNTLTVSNVQLADEDEYYCKVSSVSSSINSNVISLIVGRLIGQWNFEGNLNDGSTMGNNGAAVGTVAYEASGNSILGNALKLENVYEDCSEPNAFNFVKIAAPKYSKTLDTNDFLDYTYGPVSISCWLKPSFNNIYEMYVSAGFPGFNGAWYCARMGDSNQATLNSSGSSKIMYTTPFNDGGWHLYTAVIDPANHKRCIYLDGTMLDEDTATLIQGVELLIGGINWKARGEADNYKFGYTGLIDDVRIYTYALSQTEVAQMYYDVTGQGGCLYYQNSRDYNKDCRVNFKDFEIFAQNWMNCTLKPAAACND